MSKNKTPKEKPVKQKAPKGDFDLASAVAKTDKKGYMIIGLLGTLSIVSMTVVAANVKPVETADTSVAIEKEAPETEVTEPEVTETETTEVDTEELTDEAKDDWYVVKRGDTLSGVSGEVGISLQSLAKHNEIDDVDLIYEGQSIRTDVSVED